MSSLVKKRKREESSKEGEAKRRQFGKLYFSAEKHCEHCVKFSFVLASNRVISGIMYRTAVTIGKISPFRTKGLSALPVGNMYSYRKVGG